VQALEERTRVEEKKDADALKALATVRAELSALQEALVKKPLKGPLPLQLEEALKQLTRIESELREQHAGRALLAVTLQHLTS